MRFIGQLDDWLQSRVDRCAHALMRRSGVPKSLLTLAMRFAVLGSLAIFAVAVKEYAIDHELHVSKEKQVMLAVYLTVFCLVLVVSYFKDRADDDSPWALSTIDMILVHYHLTTGTKMLSIFGLIMTLSADAHSAWMLHKNAGIFLYSYPFFMSLAGYLIKTPKTPPPVQTRDALQTAQPQTT